MLKLVGAEAGTLSVYERLLDKIVLVRIGFYPDDEGYFAICDYSLYPDGAWPMNMHKVQVKH